jgi:hypothetical protein
MKRLVVALALGSSGCTLFGFDDLALIECRQNADCTPLNDAHDLDVTKAAEVYQCASDQLGCVLSPTDWDGDGALALGPDGQRDCDDGEARSAPGGEEVCDLLDNDCDGVVDEGLYADTEPSQSTELGDVMAVDFGTLTSSGAHAFSSLDVTVVTSAASASLHEVMSHVSVSTRELVAENPGPRAGCPFVSGELEDTIEFRACAPAAYATDGADEAVRLAAAVDRLGCPMGRLRLGRVADDRFVLPAEASACGGAFPFVSVEPIEKDCTVLDQVAGISGLELVQLPSRGHGIPAQALVSWIGTHPEEHDVCGRMAGTPVASDPVDSLSRTAVGVAAMAFWSDGATLSTSGTAGVAQPELLGITRGGGPPALEPVVLPDGSEHYIVAFGSEQGPSLRAVERVVTPETCEPGAAPALNMRSADPWHDAESTHFAADQLVIASGPVLDDACGTQRPGIRLGVAWLERCGAPDAELWFALVDFSPSTGFCRPSAPARAGSFDHRALPGQQGARLQPVLAHVQDGVLREAGLGGFVLAWIEGDGRVRARRASAEQGTFIDEAIDLAVSGARALGARRLSDGHVEISVVRATNGVSLELAQWRLSGGCGG